MVIMVSFLVFLLDFLEICHNEWLFPYSLSLGSVLLVLLLFNFDFATFEFGEPVDQVLCILFGLPQLDIPINIIHCFLLQSDHLFAHILSKIFGGDQVYCVARTKFHILNIVSELLHPDSDPEVNALGDKK